MGVQYSLKQVLRGLLIVSVFVNVCLIWWFLQCNDNGSECEIVFNDYKLNEEQMKLAEDNWQYSFYEVAYKNMYSYPTDVCFVGDSITRRCEWNELYPGLNIKNRGIGSDTTEGLLARLDSIVATCPKKIFLMIGINDLSGGGTIEATFNNYMSIIKSLRVSLPECEIYVQSCLPVCWSRAEYTDSVIELNSRLAQNTNDYVYIDLWTSFSDEKNELCEKYTIDGVHLSPLGYELWKSLIDEYVL